MAFLIVKELSSDVTVFRLGAGRISVGRGPDADIPLDGIFASRCHAAISATESSYFVTDLRSKNGTWLNGERLSGPKDLKHGDQIVVGGATLVFMEDDASPHTRTAPAPGRLVQVDANAREVRVGGSIVPVALSPQEFNLLHYLWQHSPRACPREEIGIHLWGQPAGECPRFDLNMIHQLAHRLRARLIGVDGLEATVVTVPGIGYKFEPMAVAGADGAPPNG